MYTRLNGAEYRNTASHILVTFSYQLKPGMSSKSRKRHEAVNDHKSEQAPVIPWPEWSDAELNAEKWDFPKNGTDEHFHDPEPRLMPPSLEPHDWKRGFMLKNSSSPVVFTESKEYPDFVKNNKHILHSEFVRWFISTMINLQYVGRDGLKVEGESANFTWPSETRPWKGWMYIYSMNKTGSATSEYRPIVNPNGKYVVRLFFMGFWRRFLIDDMIPVDNYGTPLLPRTENDFELWPMLLAKAMMKLAALSWTSKREINDFYPVSCFTGWICLPLVTSFLSPNEKWELLKTQDPLLLPQNSRPFIPLFANLTDANELGEETVPGVTPCWSHSIYIDEVKDITVDSSQGRWKAYRYFDWAKKHGMKGTGKFPGPAPRSLKFISPLRRCSSGDVTEGVGETLGPTIPEIGVWADFSKIAPYLEEIFMFYKPSDFEYYARVSDVLRITATDNHHHVSASGSRVKSQAAGGKDGKKTQTSASSVKAPPVFLSSLKWQDEMSSCVNDPLFMLIDSIDTKFVLIDFCSMPQRNPASSRSYLTIERHNFFEKSRDNDPTALIKTVVAGATIFEAGPGRHLYRLLFRSGYSYFMRILSDTIFHIGDRFRMYDLMSSESETLDAIAKNISNGISTAFQEFGRPEYANHLRLFYNSYMPREEDILHSNVDKKLIKTIHELFINELGKLVKETFSIIDTVQICHALRVFFLNPSIGVQTDAKKCTESSVHEAAAVRIQSFFRMALVKIYKTMHDPSHIKHSDIVQSLGKLVELFSYSKSESIAQILIRRVIEGIKCTEMRSRLYPCNEDVTKVLNIEEWKGVVRNVQPGQWVPVLRMVVNAPTTGAKVHAGIDFVTSLPRYVIRVVNNETYREVMRFVNKVAVVHYPYVDRGYTIIGYGWSDGYKFKELDWCVRVTTIKGQPRFNFPLFQPGTKPPNLLSVQELSNNYVPNVSNIIGKWIVSVATDCLLSVRLSTSYSQVETLIKITDKDDNVLCETTGGSVIILPAACLPFVPIHKSAESVGDAGKTRSRSKSLISESIKEITDSTTQYYVRAYVANDTWPLTPTEWNLVSDTKARGTVYDPRYGKTSGTSISKRGNRLRVSGRGSEDKLHWDGEITSDGGYQHPLCRLQIITDVGTKVQVEHDRRREVEIAGMKRQWEDAEPGRLMRGRDLREEFFKENSALLTKSTNSAPLVTRTSEVSVREFTDPEVSPVVLETRETRTLKPPPKLSRFIPPLNLTPYVFEDEEEQRWVKTEGDEEMLRNQRVINTLDFDQAHAAYMDEEIGLLDERRKRYFELFNSYTKKVSDWKSLGEAVYEKRDLYVAEVKAKLSVGTGKTAKDTKKKKKKN